MSVEELRKQLETLQRSHDTLLRSLAASNGSFGPSSETTNIPGSGIKHRNSDAATAVFADTSTLSGESEDEDESYFVQDELPSQSYDHEHLREHLKKHDFNEHGREILSAIITDRGRLKQPYLFPQGSGPAEDRSHYSHYQVYDVGQDGATTLIESSGNENTSRAVEAWHSIKDINADHSKDKKAVGRITIAREPSPILFGALHLAMHNAFDMDELFRHLVQTEASSAHMYRAFHQDLRHQKTFFFTFEYYTIIGEECLPMQWQRADNGKSSESHVPLSRCGAVVALALYDNSPRRIRNRGRRAKTKIGWVQNIWSPWQVLNIQCYPDWRAATDTFETGHRYLNGPEAFLHALLTEYRDARKRYEEIYVRVSKLVTPPLGFLFDAGMRDRRLFEDKQFTWIRRYFWAHQTLGTVNDSIKSMVDSFEDTFTEEVWDGQSKTLWPLFEESPRNDHWKRRLRLLRLQFEREMRELRTLMRENNERREEIASLQNHLFSGTSIQESRKSVELSDITVQQGRNIKLLTLVNLFFMPLTFTTSVFGMTNMSTDPEFWKFGVTLTTVCIPFFVLVGFLNTDSGYKLWHEKTKAVWHWIRPKPKPKEIEGEEEAFAPSPVGRTLSAEESMRTRLGQGTPNERNNPRLSHPNIKSIVQAVSESNKTVTRTRTNSVRFEKNEATV
ncbi:hypothetical protein BDV96DRAFT_486430 [Lophiotrema nucula]|uniref:Cora-like Mg2+ transporter protein-domain-containing protein n=1 Tax=Lophiotrema nucula TaxID=690887 RepID=A0A6A5ZL04_9PLEO|nr:hypothetical protein BDV96DRAFT_486430 [Lophiotrema nucula]